MNFANRTIRPADNMEVLPGIDSECVDLNPTFNHQLLCRHCNSLKGTGTMDHFAVNLTAWQR